MDFAGPGVLEWWANSSFCLTSAVHIQVTATQTGWRAQVEVESGDDFFGLLAFGNPYRLRFADGSSFLVGVARPDAEGRFEVWDWQLERDDAQMCPTCGESLVTQVDERIEHCWAVTDSCPACGYQRRCEFSAPQVA